MDAALHARLDARVAALVALYRRVQRERMDGVPLVHAGLAVHAEGFEAEADGAAAVGVLVTPWFMNLVRLPLDAAVPMAPAGATRRRVVGHTSFDFIGAHEPDFGAYEACSLFSPMFEFADQSAAEATAREVLAALRRSQVPETRQASQAPQASRRALLFGRADGAPR
ncbi:MAG TPA: [NiFe]-hydrogenase assembly chaperone HybE [Burkholderiaceae bacterium]|nr:[NiFe]-hydrogenase assembly chaperone HybE [Burkholderiaceae bacterium]